MRIVALMPTYRRSHLVENALACFLAQSHDDKWLLIGDDAGELAVQEGERWAVIQLAHQASLPVKYNRMARMAIERWQPDALAVFEDDDVYLSDYLANHAAALKTSPGGWSHCSWAWTDGSGGSQSGSLRREYSNNARFHGCLAVSASLFQKIGGWPETHRMDFDLQMLARLRSETPAADPCEFGTSQYYFRWTSTGLPHGQAFSNGPGDVYWLEKTQAAIDQRLGPVQPGLVLAPHMDSETEAVYALMCEEPDSPGWANKIARYGRAVRQWIVAGRPTRDDDEVRRIYEEICRPCCYFHAGKEICKVCGCRVRNAGGALMNKIRMATERCPREKW